MERFELKSSPNLSYDTMLSHQLSQKLKLLGNGPDIVYQSIQQLYLLYLFEPYHYLSSGIFFCSFLFLNIDGDNRQNEGTPNYSPIQ